MRTFDADDVHIAVKASDSSRSSCKQSISPSTIPGAVVLLRVSFPFENNEVNILLRLLIPPDEAVEADVDEVSAIIVQNKSLVFNSVPFQLTKKPYFGDPREWAPSAADTELLCCIN